MSRLDIKWNKITTPRATLLQELQVSNVISVRVLKPPWRAGRGESWLQYHFHISLLESENKGEPPYPISVAAFYGIYRLHAGRKEEKLECGCL
jgi:hypothetical protein